MVVAAVGTKAAEEELVNFQLAADFASAVIGAAVVEAAPEDADVLPLAELRGWRLEFFGHRTFSSRT